MSEEIEETETTEEQVPGTAVPEPATPEPTAVSDTADAASDTPEPKKKRKRLRRAERPQKTRPKRAAATGTRKAITRQPKPDHERGRRQERRGVVVSSAMDKTIVVRVEIIKMHPRYKKVIRRSTKFHAHDERNEAKVGDVVRIVETRPVSRTKRWPLAEVVEAAK